MKYSFQKLGRVLPATASLAFGRDRAVNPSPAVTGDFAAIFIYRVDDRPISETWMLSLRQSDYGVASGSGALGRAGVSADGSNTYADAELTFTSEAEGSLAP